MASPDGGRLKGKKVKLSLVRIKHHVMYGGMEVQLNSLLTSALYEGEWSASAPGEKAPGTHWRGGWVSPGAGVDAEAKRKICCLPGNRIRFVRSVV
jgi:hypothetical protein